MDADVIVVGAGLAGLVATHELTSRGKKVALVDQENAANLGGRLLVVGGLSNPEIAAQLFMSPRTVEYHLHKVFNKLKIRSRNQLRVLATRRNQPRSPNH